MFVRFRGTPRRLQLSLVETRRVDGKVRHEQVAALPSIPMESTVADRVAFWSALHERLARLANRIDAEAQGKLLEAIHARVPMVTAEEQRGLQLENAKTDGQFWGTLGDGFEEKGQHLRARYESEIEASEKWALEAKARAAFARERIERIERIERGENVEGGLGKPLNSKAMEKILRDAEWTTADIEHAKTIAELPADVVERLFDSEMEARDRANERIKRSTRRAARNLLGALRAAGRDG